MKLDQTSPPFRANRAFTVLELMIVIAVLAVMFLLILPGLQPRCRCKAVRINCVNNLKQVGLAFRIWSGDNRDRYPMEVPVSEGGALPTNSAVSQFPTASIFRIFMCMSNELNTPKVVICPADDRAIPTNFLELPTSVADFITDTSVSYFVGRDADESLPAMLLCGDRNIYGTGVGGGGTSAIKANHGYGDSQDGGSKTGSPATAPNNGTIVTFGTNILATATTPAWTDKMHKNNGNVTLADGSVQQLTSSRLRDACRASGDPNGPSGNVLMFP